MLTSGGDAAGMNAAVRAVVRTGLDAGLAVFAVYEGFQGLVDGGPAIRRVGSGDVGGILHQGGTVLGTARCEDFRARDGRKQAARNLAELGVDALVVIGGDGSLTGANIFREEWPDLLAELVEAGEIEQATADAHRRLTLVGMVGSIDNDMFGTDMTIGADTALHRITEAIDAIHSTASSHQRSFVIEVMGRNCGYLALMSALASGANFVLIPESPPDTDEWEESMCRALEAGREIGRRSNIVIVAEGARDLHGNPITAQHVKDVLEERLGEDTRVTSLGHVQRGGAPSAFDRYLSTVLGYAAVQQLLTAPDNEPQLIGLRGHHIINSPLMDCVAKTHSVADIIAAREYETAMEMRGGSFRDSFRMIRTMVRAQPHATPPGQRRLRLAVLHAGGPAPGMNTAVRVAARVGLDLGHTVLAVRNGFEGLADGDHEELDWMSVTGWVSRGGAELGTSRHLPTDDDIDAITSRIEEDRIDGILMIGGWAGYEAASRLRAAVADHPSLNIPIVCLPASINNDLPGSELSVGSDTALNSIVRDVDKIKQSAVASRRSFVVEVMGHDCGYLALMSGLATGAERVYLPEEGISLADLQTDVHALTDGFAHGKRLGLVIRSEHADSVYSTGFIKALFEREGGDLFDVREAILGHVQQGGDPSPFDRIQATRLSDAAMRHLIDQGLEDDSESAFVGLHRGKIRFTPLAEFPKLVEADARRPREQQWLDLRPLAAVMARPIPAPA
ncbi:MAG: 6-phosphofructokinase [Ilumatobacter sp.]|uniref:6-phosphofructokinase n=1 Tax=Ilumatobacter sp. TaxID=1967498 RepID=UPI00261A6098|nr:6-phosphofructokinase [Ilumatobacter sp.]MDJ0767904.1 6-phosphofructokinase [Ilumatobacter sp.]